jgi:hypothetical protein
MIIYKVIIFDEWETDSDSSQGYGYFSTKQLAEQKMKRELKRHKGFFGSYKGYIEEIELDKKDN